MHFGFMCSGVGGPVRLLQGRNQAETGGSQTKETRKPGNFKFCKNMWRSFSYKWNS